MAGGWMWKASPPMRTTFRIYFPASFKTAERTESAPDASVRGGHETVLVAEDEEILRQLVVQVLRLQGYNVLEAASGRQAIEIWEQSNCPVDLLLTDMVMPGGIMGSELAERLTSQHPKLKVIYTSGYSPGMAGKDTSVCSKGETSSPSLIRSINLPSSSANRLDTPAKRNLSLRFRVALFIPDVWYRRLSRASVAGRSSAGDQRYRGSVISGKCLKCLRARPGEVAIAGENRQGQLTVG